MYPLKFEPTPLAKIWGGDILTRSYGQNEPDPIGELILISGLENWDSVVTNGEFKGQKLSSLVADYKEKLLGANNFNKFEGEFPLLIKIIDADDDLSIQVHPDDELAKQLHNGSGKNEMWYVIDTRDENAALISGFSQQTSKEEFQSFYQTGRLTELMNSVKVKPEEVYYIPAGKVHSIGKGTLIAEIQQPSDFTYRIYDFDRQDKNGNYRELHHELAYLAMNYSDCDTGLQNYVTDNTKSSLVNSEFFVTNKLSVENEISLSYESIDSFVVLIATAGNCELEYHGNLYSLDKLEAILLPATVDNIKIKSSNGGVCKLLETYV